MNNFAMTIMTLHAHIKDLVTLSSMGAIMIHSHILIQLGCAVKRSFIVYLALNEILCVVSDRTNYFDAFRDARFAIFQLSMFVFA